MPEFLLADYLAAKLHITLDELKQFETAGIIRAVVKNGRHFYSSRDCYHLKGVLHFMRTEGLGIEEAEERFVRNSWSLEEGGLSTGRWEVAHAH